MADQHPQFPPIFQPFQDLIDSVALAPPATQGRNTRAIHFTLYDARHGPPSQVPPGSMPAITSISLMYRGLLFFRPGNPNNPIVGEQPGFDGSGMAVANHGFFRQLNDPAVEDPGQGVRVRLGFKPPRVFVTLIFVKDGPPSHPESFSPSHIPLPIPDTEQVTINGTRLDIDLPRFVLKMQPAATSIGTVLGTVLEPPIYIGSSL